MLVGCEKFISVRLIRGRVVSIFLGLGYKGREEEEKAEEGRGEGRKRERGETSTA